MSLRARAITQREAFGFVDLHHRHHKAPRGWKFGLAAELGSVLVGVAVVGRPVARCLDDGRTLEVTRCCTDGTRNACSFLYGRAARACLALGYERLVTYTLATEDGASLRAAGWKPLKQTRGGTWDCPTRPRDNAQPQEPKTLWQAPGVRGGGGADA